MKQAILASKKAVDFLSNLEYEAQRDDYLKKGGAGAERAEAQEYEALKQ